MTTARRPPVLEAAVACGVVPLFFTPEADRARRIAGALFDGGARAIEFTDRGPGALAVFSQLADDLARHDGDAIIGAGSIRHAEVADRFIERGARFIVGPGFSAAVARVCQERQVPYVPGCATPTEIMVAEAAGVELVKVFPGETLGPGFVRAVLGPMPDTRIMVTGGVHATEASIREWIAAGAACLGLGSALVTKAHADPASDADVAALTPAVAAVIAMVAAARADGPSSDPTRTGASRP